MTYLDAGAIFSDDKKHRFALWREWNHKLPSLAWIGLNPSTANEKEDDQTIRRAKVFCAEAGFGSLFMVNLFSYCETESKKLENHRVDELVVSATDFWLNHCVRSCNSMVAGWGDTGSLYGRSKEIAQRYAGRLLCLGTTNKGEPKHPLYIKATTKFTPYFPS